MNNIKCSIIIPCYNSKEYLEKCLKSIPKRDDIEIICIDDGSTDDTFNLISKIFAKRKENNVLLHYKQNKGVSYARNQGIDKAQGEYLLMLDSDDYINSKVFNEIVDNYLNSEYDMVFYDMANNFNYKFESTQNNYQSKYGNFKFIKRDFLSNLRYTIGKQYAEDKELHLKLMEKYPYCYFTKKVMYYYNWPRKGSLSAIHENR